MSALATLLDAAPAALEVSAEHAPGEPWHAPDDAHRREWFDGPHEHPVVAGYYDDDLRVLVATCETREVATYVAAAHPALVLALAEQVAALGTCVADLERMHRPVDFAGRAHTRTACAECNRTWPCPTAAAIDEAASALASSVPGTPPSARATRAGAPAPEDGGAHAPGPAVQQDTTPGSDPDVADRAADSARIGG